MSFQSPGEILLASALMRAHQSWAYIPHPAPRITLERVLKEIDSAPHLPLSYMPDEIPVTWGIKRQALVYQQI